MTQAYDEAVGSHKLPESDQSCLHMYWPNCSQYVHVDAGKFYQSTYDLMSTQYNEAPGPYASGYTGCVKSVEVGKGNMKAKVGPSTQTRMRLNPDFNMDQTPYEPYNYGSTKDNWQDDLPSAAEPEQITALCDMTVPNPSGRTPGKERSAALRNHCFAKQLDAGDKQLVEHFPFDGRTEYKTQYCRDYIYDRGEGLNLGNTGSGFANQKVEIVDAGATSKDGTEYTNQYNPVPSYQPCCGDYKATH